jgi:gliding motility-associated protein GldM
MSIPKEPRQLMINIMYLVLTAMLALNVSAEIINAFFSLDKGIASSSKIVDNTNLKVREALTESLNANKGRAEFAQWGPKADKAQQIVDEFSTYMDGVRKDLFKAAGGPNPEHPDRPLRYKDKDVTTNMFVTEKKGDEIQAKIEETRNALLAIINPDERKAFEGKLPLLVDAIADDSKAKTWSEYKFKQMPVAAILPTLSKIVNDAKTSGSAVLNYALDKASGKFIYKPDKFIVAISPKKAYLIAGKDKFEAELAMGAYSSTSNNITMTGQGSSVPVTQGVGKYSGGVESAAGEKTFTATATMTNPATGEKTKVESTFKYEVGQASVAVSADKMNVFYIGVPNPISVAAAGVSSNSLRVNASGGGASITGSGKSYTVNVATPSDCTVSVSSPDMAAPASFKFRVKRIPDPVAKIGGKLGGTMGNGEIKAQEGIIPELANFDFDVRCQIQGFKMTRVPKRQDPIEVVNTGGRFADQVAALIAQAKPGDSYYFNDVKARCPGDVTGREINSLSFTIR